ncbi:YeiH family protein [Orbaceae bacterium ESL0727]|nr:YeiH family protein [Orbaceae bacterium ESL0727]
MHNLIKYFGGILLSLLLSVIAIYVAKMPIIKNSGISAIVLAIIIGLVIGNIIYPKLAPFCHLGVDWCKGRILRLAIILFGVKLTFQEIALVGSQGIVIDILMVTLTFLLTLFLGIKCLKMDKESAILIGSGCSICGAAAVIATQSTLNAKSEKVTMAVAVVVIFGTIAMFIYPLIYNYMITLIPIKDTAFGIYIGSTIHEVAQVVAAGNAISEPAVETAVITKMIRVLLLAPFLLCLSFYLVRQTKNEANSKRKIVIPWFAIGFLLMACINSLGILPAIVVHYIIFFDDIFLTMAMAALGLTSHYSAFQKAGIKPLLLGVMIFAWLIIGGAAINLLIANLLA